MKKYASLAFFVLAGLLVACSCPPTQDCEELLIDTKYVHKYGVPVPKPYWEESGQNGQIIKTLKQGIVCSQSYYCGKLEGETTYTFPFSDQIEKAQVYSQDQLIKEVIYHPNGQPKEETTYVPTENVTIVRQWFENGVTKSYEKWSGSQLVRAEYYDTLKQRLSCVDEGCGIRTFRDSYGQLVSTENYSDGQCEYRTNYYPNGTPCEVTPYRYGLIDGLRKTYYPGGEPKTIENWVAGKQQGTTTIFRDGQKVQEIQYANGQKNGKGIIYKDGDIIAQEVTWKDDLLHGPSLSYMNDMIATEWYFKGNKVTKGYYDSFHLKPTIETVTTDLCESAY